MAGAGYKLFNSGDVLTAAQVNEFLMQQTCMVFADAAARTTALSGVVAEGMISYLKDTNAVEVYNGSAWVASDDPNAIQNTIVDAKGDLIAATANDTPARLAVGNDGETLVADSSTTTGLRWQADWNTGKNKIINGDFNIWQRGTSFTATGYTADRWYFSRNNTTTLSRQTFTPGTAPVAGYEGTYFIRLARTSGSSDDYLVQKVEDIRTLAGQTATISFWAKADANATISQVYLGFNAGSGGSNAPGGVGNFSGIAITTSWVRYSVTVSVPSLSGTTIGTSSFTELVFKFDSGFGNRTVDIWGVQWEASSVATPFTTATGSIGGELALCQRYYHRFTASDPYAYFTSGNAQSTSDVYCAFPLGVTMRTKPTAIDTSGMSTIFLEFDNTSSIQNPTAIILGANAQAPEVAQLTLQKSGVFTTGRFYRVVANNSSTAFIGFSAEL